LTFAGSTGESIEPADALWIAMDPPIKSAGDKGTSDKTPSVNLKRRWH